MPSLFGGKKKKEELQRRAIVAEFQLNVERENAGFREEARQHELEAERAKFVKMQWQHEEDERKKREAAEKEREHNEWKAQQEKAKIRMLENERNQKLRQRSPEAVRRLRQLIRTRYQLDCNIWTMRNVHDADHDLVYQEMVKSDATLNEIAAILDTWDENGWDPQDWALAKRIKERLAEPVKRVWQDDPPWQEGALG